MTWGDPYITAGYRIECKLPAPIGLTTESGKVVAETSEYISGQYLVSHVRHMFNKIQYKMKYTNSLELIKGSYGQSGGK